MGDIDNLINTTLPKSIRKVYQGIVEETVAKVVTGLETPQKAISTTVSNGLIKASMVLQISKASSGELILTQEQSLTRLLGVSIVKQERHQQKNWELIHSITQ